MPEGTFLRRLGLGTRALPENKCERLFKMPRVLIPIRIFHLTLRVHDADDPAQAWYHCLIWASLINKVFTVPWVSHWKNSINSSNCPFNCIENIFLSWWSALSISLNKEFHWGSVLLCTLQAPTSQQLHVLLRFHRTANRLADRIWICYQLSQWDMCHIYWI